VLDKRRWATAALGWDDWLHLKRGRPSATEDVRGVGRGDWGLALLRNPRGWTAWVAVATGTMDPKAPARVLNTGGELHIGAGACAEYRRGAANARPSRRSCDVASLRAGARRCGSSCRVRTADRVGCAAPFDHHGVVVSEGRAIRTEFCFVRQGGPWSYRSGRRWPACVPWQGSGSSRCLPDPCVCTWLVQALGMRGSW